MKHIISNKDNDTFSSIIFTTLLKAKDISISIDNESAIIKATNIIWQDIEYEYGVHKISIKYAFHNFDNDTFNDSDYIAYQVGDRAVKEVFPVQKKFEFKDDNKGKCLICFVRCELLDKTTNNNWKNFNLNRKEWNDFNKSVQGKIYNEIVFNNLDSDIADIQKQQAIMENPHLKPILATYDKSDFLNGKEAVNRAIRTKEDILKDYFSSKSENLFNEENLNIIQQSALAELMITRFRTLEEAYRICNEKTPDGKYVNEDKIHNLLIPKGTINTPNNLWLLDARWQYANLISSDNTINKTLRKYFNLDEDTPAHKLFQKNKIPITIDISKDYILNYIDKEPDVAIFNNESIVILEFKKPDVDANMFVTKTEMYAKLFALTMPQYQRFFIYLISGIHEKPTGFELTTEGLGSFLPNMKLTFEEKYDDGRMQSHSLGNMYFEVCTYNKFLKDCYMQHHPFFKTIDKKIEALDKYIPTQINS